MTAVSLLLKIVMQVSVFSHGPLGVATSRLNTFARTEPREEPAPSGAELGGVWCKVRA